MQPVPPKEEPLDQQTAPKPLREVLLNTEINSDFYETVRTEVFSRNDFRDELEGLLGELTADPVRLGVAYEMLGRREQAIEALAQGTSNPWAMHILGRLLLNEGRTQSALELLDKGFGTHNIPEIGALLAEARANAGETEAATTLLEQLASSMPEAHQSFLRGVIAERDGEYAEALNLYEAAADADNAETIYHFRLGYLHALHGDEDRAVRAYERCQRATPVYARALINLGILYEDREQFEQAATCYRMVLSSNPEHERAKLYLRDVEASLNMYYDREKEKEKSRRNQILQIPVTDFELSVRSRNCLAKMNIHTLGDLIKKTEAELLSYKNFGETSLAEIKKILAQKGFRLGQGIEDKPTPRSLPDSEHAKVLAEPVSVLDLSSRAQRCMDRLGIETLADLVKRTELELISQKNFGMTSLNELKTKLKERGLSLASG